MTPYVVSISRFAPQKWEIVKECLNTWAPVDDFAIQLWDYPPEQRQVIEAMNPRWRIIGDGPSPFDNPVLNLWKSRYIQLKTFLETSFPFLFVSEDDIRLEGKIEKLPLLPGATALTAFRKYPFPEIPYTENGIILSRDVVESIVDDYGRGPAAHEDRLLFLLAYLHGFDVRGVPNKSTRHVVEKGFQSWTYEDKKRFNAYGDFNYFVTHTVIGVPGNPKLSPAGVARHQSAKYTMA